jgi:hypothetical protein
MRDDSYVKVLARLFTSVKRLVDAAVARGETLEQTRKSVNLDEFRRELANDSRVKKMLFATYVASPAVAAAFRDASAAAKGCVAGPLCGKVSSYVEQIRPGRITRCSCIQFTSG